MYVKIHSPDDAKLGYFQVWGFMNILEYALVFRCIILQVYSKFITIRIMKLSKLLKEVEENGQWPNGRKQSPMDQTMNFGSQ